MRTTMPGGIIAMSLLQFVVAVYIVLGIATELKIRYKIVEPRENVPPSLAKVIRDTGPVLFLVPAGRTIYALRRWKKNGTDFRESAQLLITGIAGLILLIVIAVLGSRSVWGGGIISDVVSIPSSRSDNPLALRAAGWT